MTFGYNAEYGQKLDNQILRLLWTKRANGVIKQGRRLVAKKRINASYKMGGLQMDFTRDTAMGLLTNFIQKIFNLRGIEGEKPFVYELFAEYIRGLDTPNLEELINMGGPRIWRKISKKWTTNRRYLRKYA
jgi:hypothetical protein